MSDSKPYGTVLVWLRRDLRLRDNVALYEACRHSDRVAIAFVLNPPLLAQERMGSPLVSAFLSALTHLREELRSHGSDLLLLKGDFAQELGACAAALDAQAVFFNDDYEPEAITRDDEVCASLTRAGLKVRRSLDHVYFGAEEILRADGQPYRIFTPYKRCWLERRAVAPRSPIASYPALSERLERASALPKTAEVPTARDLGFDAPPFHVNVSEESAITRLDDFLDSRADRYRDDRDVPAIEGTSGLSADLRAGTIGIRTCVEAAFMRRSALHGRARESIEVWISELIWRDFYQMIYKRFPHVATRAFLPKADGIAWNAPGAVFAAWCAGRTGYPIIDAGMRQLNAQGWMHNRLRMLTASFLTKHLLIDWRLGALYFEQHLIDADPAQNNGGWQWAASTGTDAAPYFRIFNPVVQSKRFDPDGEFITRFVPELQRVPKRYIHEPWKMPAQLQRDLGILIGSDYPSPVVEHSTARTRALAVFGRALHA